MRTSFVHGPWSPSTKMHNFKAPHCVNNLRYFSIPTCALHSSLPINVQRKFKMKAVIMQAPKKAELVDGRPVPKLRPSYIKVKTVAVALNPTGKSLLSRNIRQSSG